MCILHMSLYLCLFSYERNIIRTDFIESLGQIFLAPSSKHMLSKAWEWLIPPVKIVKLGMVHGIVLPALFPLVFTLFFRNPHWAQQISPVFLAAELASSYSLRLVNQRIPRI